MKGWLRFWIWGLVSLTALVVSLVVGEFGWPPGIDAPLHDRIAHVLAESALSHLAPQGRVTILSRDTETFVQPALKRLSTVLQNRLSKAGVVNIDIRSVQVDPLRPVEAPSGDISELIRRGKTGDVIISLVGPPLLNPEQRAVLGTIRPSIIAFCPGSSGTRVEFSLLFEAGLLRMAIAPRPTSGNPGDRGLRGSAAFDRIYQVLVPLKEPETRKR